MSYSEFDRIEKDLTGLLDYYKTHPEKIYAKTLKNLINTCKYKKSLIKLNDIDCIKEGKLSINPKNLKFMKKTDEKLLKKYFPDEVILFFNNPELLNKQLTISGINKLENCSAKNKTGGKTKKMRSTKRKRTKKR